VHTWSSDWKRVIIILWICFFEEKGVTGQGRGHLLDSKANACICAIDEPGVYVDSLQSPTVFLPHPAGQM
jgi:hypothetical protein